MAEDDLDAFFDEVSADEAAITEEDAQKEEEEEIKPPQAKKLKRPVGVVVAASSSKVVAIPLAVQEVALLPAEDKKIFSIPPPPPPPPPAIIPAAAPTHLPASDANAANKKGHVRSAAGKVWQDNSLADWPENDYRLFVGNLSHDVTDQQLYEHFTKYPSLQMVKVIHDLKGTSKGYGFVSLLEPMECARAIREMDQTWLASRPIKVKRSDWKDRELKNVKHKKKQQHRKMKRSL